MVSIDLYKILERTKKEIIRRIEEISVESHPIDFAWLLYTLQYEKDTPLFTENFKRLKRWSFSDISGKNDRDLGALALYVHFMKKFNETNNVKVLGKINTILKRNLDKLTIKYSVLNNPGEVFLLSLISDQLERDFKIKLSENIVKNLNGTLSRKILFLAALLNLEFNIQRIRKYVISEIFSVEPERIEDMIATIWFFKKYKKFKTVEEIPKIWDKINGMYLSIEDENGRLLLSTQNLALVYEAINIELLLPNPFFIFSLYPFEEDIRKVCGNLFKNEEYSSAVFQATLKLLELIKNKAKEAGMEESKIENLNERTLIREVTNPRKLVGGRFVNKSEDEILIKFNPLLNQLSGKNEQEGLALILEGILLAFRHPKGHNPKDHGLAKVEPYDALSQLIFIDHLWKRIKNAEVQGELS